MDTTMFAEIGFSEGETRVYLALLKIGLSSSGEIIRESKLQSSSVYHILDILIDKGIVSSQRKNNRKYFYAVSPEKLADLISEKEKKLEENRQALLSFIPEILSSNKRGKISQEVLIYEGWKGILSAFEEAYRQLKPGTTTYAYTITKEFGGADPKKVRWLIDKIRDIRNKINKKYREKIKMNILAEQGSDIAKDQAKTQHTAVRYIEPHYINPAVINIYGEVTVIALWLKNPIAIYIVSKEVADSFRNNFDLLWRKN